MAGTRAPCKDAQPMGTGGHCCHAAVCRQRSDCSWFRPSSTRGHVWRGSVDTTKAVKDKMSAVALRSILALHPRDCSSDVLYGDTGLLPPGVLIDAAKLCWQQCQNMEAGRWPRRRCDSHSRVAVVSRQWARTGAVMSNPLLSRSSTPEYCQGDCTGKGQPALRRVAPRRSPHHSPYVV
jgi:Tfp pilus assembly protein PilV